MLGGMRRALRAAAAGICGILTAWAGAGAARAESLPFFPLVQGLSWTYAGTVSWPGHRTPIVWKSEIVGVVRGADLVAARFRGMPFDLSGYAPGLKPEDSIVAEVRGRGVFIATGPAVTRLWREIRRGRDGGYVRAQAARGGEFVPLFPYPLRPTDPAAAAAVAALGGTMQVVSAPRPFDVARVAGSPLKPGEKADAWPVGFSAGTERTTFSFVPRLGIVSYDDHAGPVQVSVRLVRIAWEKIGD